MKREISLYRRFSVLVLFVAMLFVSACSSMHPITVNVYSEPEGAHVLYKLDIDEPQSPPEWVYLGSTPLKAVKMIDGWDFDSANKVTLKVLRNGYIEQIKEWNAENFHDEYKDKGVIFWSPTMIPSKH